MLSIPGMSYTKKAESTFFSKYGALLEITLRVSDVAVVIAVAYAIYWLRFDQFALQDPYDLGLVRAVLLTLLVFPVAGVYRSWRGESLADEIGKLWLAWTGVMLLLLLLEWAVKSTGEYSRISAVAWFVSTGAVLSIDRLLMRKLLGHIRSRGVDSGQRIVSATRGNAWMGLDVVGYVSTNDDQVDIHDLSCLADLDTFLASLDSWSLDQIWIALPVRAESTIQRVLQATLDKPITIRFVPDFFGYELINHHATALGGVPVITLRGSRVEGHASVLKAIEDRLIALILLVLLSPLMLLVAGGVKLSSPGPVLYRQKRHGLGGKEIDVLKFRSMRVHAEGAGHVTQAQRNDSRVTSFGRFLRSSSLDELPQLLNVLRGEMSIVGPRPHAVEHNRHFSERLHGYMQRHGVKPGMTGLAQVRGFRGETDTLEKMASRVECDIHYIQHWSLWLDLKIILCTPFIILRRTNAY